MSTKNTWWQEARDRWRAVHLQGSAMRDPDLADAIREAAHYARTNIFEVIDHCIDWPGQWREYLSAVVNTENIDVRPANAADREGGCTCFDNPPCSYCCTNEYWCDWVLPDDYYGDSAGPQ